MREFGGGARRGGWTWLVLRVRDEVGLPPATGGGCEVWYSDAGWGVDNSRNLVGRFTSSSFTLTRYARAQDYFLRSYDGSAPPKYSRYSTALHVDYPLT